MHVYFGMGEWTWPVEVLKLGVEALLGHRPEADGKQRTPNCPAVGSKCRLHFRSCLRAPLVLLNGKFISNIFDE